MHSYVKYSTHTKQHQIRQKHHIIISNTSNTSKTSHNYLKHIKYIRDIKYIKHLKYTKISNTSNTSNTSKIQHIKHIKHIKNQTHQTHQIHIKLHPIKCIFAKIWVYILMYTSREPCIFDIEYRKVHVRYTSGYTPYFCKYTLD